MKLYTVIKSNGRAKRTRTGAIAAYDTISAAKRNARCKGDSVVELEFNLEKKPLYIHGFVLKEGEWSPT